MTARRFLRSQRSQASVPHDLLPRGFWYPYRLSEPPLEEAQLGTDAPMQGSRKARGRACRLNSESITPFRALTFHWNHANHAGLDKATHKPTRSDRVCWPSKRSWKFQGFGRPYFCSSCISQQRRSPSRCGSASQLLGRATVTCLLSQHPPINFARNTTIR